MNLKHLPYSDNVLDCTPHIPTIVDGIIEHMPLIVIFLGLSCFIFGVLQIVKEITLFFEIRRREKRGIPPYVKYETYTESLNPSKHSDYP